MDDFIKNIVMGIDTNNEIFTLWYEVTYLRMIISVLINKNIENKNIIPLNDEEIENLRKEAQKLIQNRFPEYKIKFCKPEEKITEEPQEST